MNCFPICLFKKEQWTERDTYIEGKLVLKLESDQIAMSNIVERIYCILVLSLQFHFLSLETNMQYVSATYQTHQRFADMM